MVRVVVVMGEIIYLKDRVINMTTATETPKLTVSDVASAFLNMESMTHKKLQKLCYYAYSWRLTLHGEHLFNNKFEAWIHGPVDPELYQKYRVFGWQPIPGENGYSAGVTNEIYDFLTDIYNSYGHLTGDELENLTHTEQPWIKARQGLADYEPSNNEIEDATIITYYSKVFEDGQNV